MSEQKPTTKVPDGHTRFFTTRQMAPNEKGFVGYETVWKPFQKEVEYKTPKQPQGQCRSIDEPDRAVWMRTHKGDCISGDCLVHGLRWWVVWTSQQIDPRHISPEPTTQEPYVMSSPATCSGGWASGPEDHAPAEQQWEYDRMMRVDGLFGAGDTIGRSAHKFSSVSFTEGRIAAKAAVRYVEDMGDDQPQVSEQE